MPTAHKHRQVRLALQDLGEEIEALITPVKKFAEESNNNPLLSAVTNQQIRIVEARIAVNQALIELIDAQIEDNRKLADTTAELIKEKN